MIFRIMHNQSDLLTIEQAAAFLNVSETSLRRWTNDGRLPCARIGKKRIRRFKRSDLVTFLDMGEAYHPNSKTQAKHTLIGGIKVSHGTHLCSCYTSEEGRQKLALDFISDGLQQDCACHVICTPKVSSEMLAQLRHYRPNFQKDINTGRLSISSYCETPSEQLSQLEKICTNALKTGARTIRLVGNISEGLMAKANHFKYILQFEKDLDERLSKKFPLVTLCQYDARAHTGPELVEVMKCHRDMFCYPPERLLF